MNPRTTRTTALSIPLPAIGRRTLAVSFVIVAMLAALLALEWSNARSAQGQTACAPIDLGTLEAGPDSELTASGSWSTKDCDSRFRTGSDAHTYRFELGEGGRIRVNLTSADGDSYLYLMDEDGRRITYNDDSGAGLDARLERDLAPGVYMVEATTLGGRKRGSADFSLTVSRVTGCDPVHLGTLGPGVGLTASGSWSLDTCGSRFVVEHPAHGYLFEMPQDGRVLIDLMSENGDPVLSLVSLTEGLIAANDDGGERRNSRIERYLQAGTYLLEATTYLERDFQPLMSDFVLVVNLVDEQAKQERFLLKIEESRTPDVVVAGQPFPVDFRVGNLGGGSLAEVGGYALVYVVGPRVLEVGPRITAAEGRWESGVSYHTSAGTAGNNSVEIGHVRPFEVSFGSSGPTWLFVGAVTYNSLGEEVGFHGLWRNLTVLSGTPLDSVTVKVDDADYVVEAVADAEGLVTTSVSAAADPEAGVDPSVQAKAIYAAGVHSQVLDGIFEQPAIAALLRDGESAPAAVDGASSSALSSHFAGQYTSAVAASGLAEALAAEEALVPMEVEDIVTGIAQESSEQFVTLAESWSALQERVDSGDALSYEEAFEVHSQFAYAERVISPAVAAGEIVAAASNAELGWEDPQVLVIFRDLQQRASCGDTDEHLQDALEGAGVSNVEEQIRLAAEMRVASPITGLTLDAVLCAIAEADDENSLFLRGLAIAGNSEIQELFGYDQPSLEPTGPAPVRLRIIARLAEEGYIEHGVELASGHQILPTSRFLSLDTRTGSWRSSSDVEVAGVVLGRIQGRILQDGRAELSFVDATGEMISPDLRYLAADIPAGVWLRSGEISAMPEGAEE
ncbi:MAG: PPC domain-containing protein [Chloroflexota bacterium]|nr:PPC domain-containing protein [Chloroflexota bacterium]